MNRARVRRLAATVIVGSLLAVQAFAGTAGAADTRLIYVGSGPVSDLTTNGKLTLSPVTIGGVSVSPVIVKNIDNQALNHVIVKFMAPIGGLALTGRYGPDSGNCSAPGTVPMVCDFGGMKAGATKTFTVVYSATGAGAATVSAEVTFNETKPNGGSNGHIEPVTGGVIPQDGGCDLVVTYMPPGHSGSIGTPCAISASNTQATAVVVPGSVESLITVGEATTTNCKAGFECFGDASLADVAVDGTYTVLWTITWQVPSNFNLNKFGVLHFPDGSSVADLAITWKQNQCKNANATGCFVPGMTTLVGTTLTSVIKTSGNGSMRGVK